MSDTPLARRFLAPALAVVAVAAIAAGAILLSRHSGTTTEPPPLHLLDLGTAPSSAADSSNGPAAGPPTLTAPLPPNPARLPVRTLPAGPAPQATVVALARALGLSSDPLRTNNGWQLVSGERRLTVTDTAGWPWTLGPSLNPGGPIRCHVIDRQLGRLCPGPGGPRITIPPPNPILPASPPVTASPVPMPITPLPAPNRPTDAEALAAARPVLSALGLGTAPTQVQRMPGQVQVIADPVLDGLPTTGFETRLMVDAHRQLTGGTGWLGTPTAGQEYPLISAAAALAGLPWPATGVHCGGTTCPRPEVVDARLGLALRWDTSGRPVLVPAWIYQMHGQSAPLVAIAVDPRYWSQDNPSNQPSATSGGGSGSEPGGAAKTGQPGSTPSTPLMPTR